MKSLKIILIVICLFSINIAFSQNEKSTLNSSEIIALKQNAISNVQYNTSVIDPSSTGVTTRGDASSDINSLEQALSHTKAGSSQRLQIQLSLFTLKVSQEDTTESRQTLQNLVKEYPDDPIVQIYGAAYAYVLEFGDYRESLKKLKSSSWKEMPRYVEAFDVVDRSFNLHIDTSADEIKIKDESEPIIIVLGYALNLDGSMDNVLVQRLKTALGAYNKYPNAKIIVSGGGVIAGVTESYQMEQWLIAHKVPAIQIILEDLSISTVWNALNTINLIKDSKLTIQDIILITSTSHIRRAHAVFQQALENEDMSIEIHSLASAIKGYNLSEPISNHEKSLIIKDTFRTAGIWQMPGMVL